MVNRIVPYHSSDSASHKHTVTFYFLPVRSRQLSASISTGTISCVHTSLRPLGDHYPDRSWSSLSFFLHDHASYIRGLWNGFKLTILQIQLAFGNIWDGFFYLGGLILAAYIIALSAIKKSPGDVNANGSRRGQIGCVGGYLNGTPFQRIHDYASLYAAQSAPDIWRGGYTIKDSHCCAADCVLASQAETSKRFETYIVCAVFLMGMANNFGLNNTRNHGGHGQ